jgi:predicted GNAT family acetyltransferase
VTAVQTRARRLLDGDATALRWLLDADPIANCVLRARLDAAGGCQPRQVGGVLLGTDADHTGELSAACFAGTIVQPVGAPGPELDAVATALAQRPRRCAAIVGPDDSVAQLWSRLRPAWGPARLIRPAQPLLVARTGPPRRRDGNVRPISSRELSAYLPAATAMLAEELGVRPTRRDYRWRHQLGQLAAAGRLLARFDQHGAVVFKAEIAAVTEHCAQIQGVWVHPHWRGRGIGTAAMAAVLEHALRLAPLVSLYVNDFNEPALRLYRRIGFTEVGRFATVLF